MAFRQPRDRGQSSFASLALVFGLIVLGSVGPSLANAAPSSSEHIPFYFVTYFTEGSLGKPLQYVWQLLFITRHFNPDSPMYMITNVDTITQDLKFKKAIETVKVTLLDIKQFSNGRGSQHQRLYNYTYNADYMNNLAATRFCYLADAAKMHGHDRIYFLDSDFAAFTDFDKFFEPYKQDLVTSQFHTAMIGVWKHKALDSFCDYIAALPKKSPEERRKSYELGQQPWWKPGKPIEWGDMFIHRAWLKQTPESEISRILLAGEGSVYDNQNWTYGALDNPVKLLFLEKDLKGKNSILMKHKGEKYKCYWVDEGIFVWGKDAEGRTQPHFADSTDPILAVHFQGKCKDEYVPHLSQYYGELWANI